jgi:hypothetical protein
MATARLNISVPKEFIERMKAFAPNGNVSKFIMESVEEKIAEEEKKEALKFFADTGPLFPHIKDSAKYVHDIRQKDTKHRAKKIGI